MGETLRQARQETTGAQWEPLARYQLGNVEAVEDKGKTVSVPTRKIQRVEVQHSGDRDAVVSFIPQPLYLGTH